MSEWTIEYADDMLRIVAPGGGILAIPSEKDALRGLLDAYEADGEDFAELRPGDGWLLRVQKDRVLATYFDETMDMEVGFAVDETGCGDAFAGDLRNALPEG